MENMEEKNKLNATDAADSADSMDSVKATVLPDNSALQPGEKGFTLFLLLVGLFFTWQSWLLYCKDPGASSYGAVPLACSSLIVLFALATIFVDRKKKTPVSGLSLWNTVKEVFVSVFPQDMFVILCMVLAYSVGLYVKLGFMIITPIFLWCGMTYLSRGNYLKNLLWTALCMGFIYVVFKLLFSVVLP
jgi:hypothetical protein